jgi:enterochelin esterase-like enzyme
MGDEDMNMRLEDSRVSRFIPPLLVFLAGLLSLMHNAASAQQSAPAKAADNLSGRWSGAIELKGNDGSVRSEPLYLKLLQTGANLTGSGGSSFEANSPIVEAIVQGNRLTILLKRVNVTLRFELQHEGSELIGTVRSSADATRTAVFKAKRTGDLLLEDYHPPLSYEEGDRSQAILQLREGVRTERPNAVEDFWQRLAKTGAPIVEPIPGNEESFLVTFVWKGSEITKHVLLVRGRFTEAWPVRHLLSRIPETNVWFKTLKLPRGLRLRYGYSENDGRGSLPPERDPRKIQHDPLNTQRIQNQSVLELSGAAPQPWYVKRPEVPTLTLTKHRLKSALLGNEREILAYTPPGYDSKRAEPYPTVYLFDGNDPDGEVFASQTFENLIYERKIPPVIVIRIVNPPGRRGDDLACNEGYSRFLADELAPFVRSNYHVSPLASKTVIGGKSIGGLAAACVGMHQPNVFGLLLVQSGSFWWQPLQKDWAEPNWVARRFATISKLPLTFYIEAGIWEVDLYGNGGNIIETSRHLRDVLIAKGYPLTYREFAGDHDTINWRGSLADGLIALLGPLLR